MRFAKQLGLPAAQVDTITVGGRPLLLVERYDRVVHPDGTVERVHQEDMCQAFGIPPARKYEEDRGPSLRQMAQLIGEVSGREAVEALLRATTLNELIGNGDAHAKNFSLLHAPDGVIRFAPLYDLMSSRLYGDTRLAMRIDGEYHMDRVGARQLMDEAATWGIRRERAAELIANLLERVPDASDKASAGGLSPPEELLSSIGGERARLQKQLHVL
jgi:serine/threonine-protein kinase HipA